MIINKLLSEELNVAWSQVPVADAFAGTKTGVPVNLGLYERCSWIVQKGVGATGTATFTVEACSDTSGTGATAIPFTYRRENANSVAGAITQATAAGFLSTAGSNEVYIIEAKASDCPDGKPYLRLKSVESVASPIVGAIICLLGNPRYSGTDLPSAIA